MGLGPELPEAPLIATALLWIWRTPGRLACWFGSHRKPKAIRLDWCITWECARPGCRQLSPGNLQRRRR